MREIVTKVYTYAELSDAAKARARDWLREANAGDNFFAEHVTDQFHEALKALGFDPYVRAGRYLDPRDPRAVRSTLEWSGFWSQGDGAAFGGTWRAADFAPGKLLADRPATYERDGKTETSKGNAELHRIAGELKACKAAGMTFAALRTSHRGFHMSVDSAEHDQPDEFETDAAEEDYRDACTDSEERFITAARDLAHQFYKDLEAEYEYQNSDDAIAESIEANEYEFTEDGERA